MTREEAIATRAKVYESNGSGWKSKNDFAAAEIDSFVKLGMLKIDEPPNVAEETFVEAVRSWPYGWTPRACLEDLKAKGLKIVEK